jgi:hypothetical protein
MTQTLYAHMNKIKIFKKCLGIVTIEKSITFSNTITPTGITI